jgi:hypothetical protein
MATKNQYDACKAIYDEELKRYTELTDKGKMYLGVCTFFVGGSALKLNEVFANSPWWAYWTYALALAAFAAAFVFIVISLGVYPYETAFDPQVDFIDTLGPAPPTDEDFFDDRIADVAVACTRNVEQNEIRARHLQRASYALLAGVVLGLAGVFMVFFHGDLKPAEKKDVQEGQRQEQRQGQRDGRREAEGRREG